MKQLGELQGIEEELDALGYRLLAVAPDKPTKAAETERKLGLDFPVYSDASAAAIRAFGLGFVQTDARYEQLLEDSSGRDHHVLPVPAVAIVDEEKAIRFLHADPRYQLRLPADLVLAAARAWAPASGD